MAYTESMMTAVLVLMTCWPNLILPIPKRSSNWKLIKWPGRDVFSDGLPVMGCIRPAEIIPAAQKNQIEMHSAGRNNPCGAKEPDRDASDRGKVIPVEQKSKSGMHLTGAK